MAAELQVPAQREDGQWKKVEVHTQNVESAYKLKNN